MLLLLMKKKKGIVFIVLLFLSVTTFSQTGKIRGKITDAKTGEALIGATVLIQGTTDGTTSDLDGNYSIESLKPGKYVLVFRYVSFTPQIVKDIIVSENGVTVLNVPLQPMSVGLKQVVIKAQAIRRTEAAMLTIQKKSSNVIEGMSSEQIQRAGDSDAAGALKRVTGVNVVGGKYIYVRGLNDRYSKTTLNGAEIPGLDPNKYTVQMDIFPSSLIANIIVYKSFSPDLPGDFTGGLVNIETRDFPERFTLEAGVSLSYNTNANFNKNFITYQGSSTDFLGYDNGSRNIPSLANGKLPQYPAEKGLLTRITTSFNKVMAPENKTAGPNGSMFFAIGNQKTVKGHSLGYQFGMSYKKENTFYQNGEKNLYHLGGAHDKALIPDHKYNDTQGNTEYLCGALGGLFYKISPTQKIGLTLFKNQSGISTARNLFGQQLSDDAGGLYLETRVLSWTERSLNNAQLKGNHYFKDLSGLRINWIGSYTYSYQNEPDRRFFTNSYRPDLSGEYRYSIEPSIYNVPARYYRYLNENNYNFKVDFSLQAGKGENAPTIKWGGDVVYKNRIFHEKRLDYRFQFSQYVYDGNVAGFISDQNIGLNYPGYDPQTGTNFGLYIQGNPGDDRRNSYTGTQRVYAGYAMIKALLWNKLSLNTGLRFEHTYIYTASNDSTLKPGVLNNNDFLPALNLTWHLKKNMNLRLNGTRTLARPNFRELAPYASQDFAGGEIYVGNSHLKRTTIDNFDVRWENYLSRDELFSLGVFYKIFTSPIELVDNPKAQNTELSWENVDHATVYGVELDFRKKLDFFALTKNFKININFSYVVSQVAIDSLELAAIRATDPAAKAYRPMNGQSPYIINAMLTYAPARTGWEASLVYNVTGPKLLINVKGGTPDIYEQPYHDLGLVVKKQLNKRFVLSFKAQNLLNAVYKETYTFKSQEYIYRKYRNGRTFEAGISYKLLR
jgi:outer membrane receptor for ferrienterochelin and colicin